jgi:hypothetical protein
MSAPRDPEPGAGSSKQLVWIFPDRSSVRQRPALDSFFELYAELAPRAGFSVQVVAPEAVEVDSRPPAAPTVSIHGEPVTPESAVFVTDVYLLPHQERDGVAQIMLAQLLQLAGFYLPVPLGLSLVANDKTATHVLLRDGPFSILPTVRVQSGRDLYDHDIEALVGDLAFPLMVKPATWGMGIGMNVARTPDEVRNLVALGSGADTVMVLQPFLGPGASDYRVYAVDGRPHTILCRTPQDGRIIANLARGGRGEVVSLPAELQEPVAYVSRTIDVPFLCIDFLHDGERFWLSEVELDGAIARVDPATIERLLVDRFRAYARHHDEWCERARSRMAGSAR